MSRIGAQGLASPGRGHTAPVPRAARDDPGDPYRLFPSPDDHVEVQEVLFYAFRSPPMQTSLYEMFQEFGLKKVQDFLLAFHDWRMRSCTCR
jgi:hypothetical protein